MAKAGLTPSPSAELQNTRVFQAGADQVTGNTDTNNFNIWKYPSDIGTPEIPHYVMFYATIRKSDLSATQTPPETANINFDPSNNNSIPAEQSAVELTAGVGGAKLLQSLAGKSFLGLPFAVVGFGAGVKAASSDSFKALLPDRTKYLIKDVVAVYLSGKPSVQYTASWADVDIGLAGQLANNLGQTVNDIKQFDFSEIKQSATKTFGDFMKGVDGMTAALILKAADKSSGALGNFGASLQASAAVVPNPFKAQLFHTMGFRTFTFDYTFLPKNQEEYTHVQNIIKTFKKYMHPVVGGDKYLMNYPAEWNIAYYYKGAVNDQLFKIANCALTGCKVEYGGTDFTTFKRIAGGPTEISMQLSFVELELLTRARIEAGY